MSIHQITPRIGIVVAVRLAYVQVTRADAYAAAGNVVRLEDGSSTKRYNGRLRAIDQQISRGMIYDRKRIPIATSNWQELQRIRRTYEAMGIDIDKSCSLRDSLHYPLGAAAFHLVSDVRTLYRWRARNAHFEEKISRVRLTGYDDRENWQQGSRSARRESGCECGRTTTQRWRRYSGTVGTNSIRSLSSSCRPTEVGD